MDFMYWKIDVEKENHINYTKLIIEWYKWISI